MQREVVHDVPFGTVCRFKGEWGVIGRWVQHAKMFDRWDAPPILLKEHEIVEVPKQRPMGQL